MGPLLQVQDFVDIKLDARNLIEADVKSALTDLDWFGKETAGGTATPVSGVKDGCWAAFYPGAVDD